MNLYFMRFRINLSGVRLESVWKGNELLSVIIKEEKKHNGK